MHINAIHTDVDRRKHTCTDTRAQSVCPICVSGAGRGLWESINKNCQYPAGNHCVCLSLSLSLRIFAPSCTSYHLKKKKNETGAGGVAPNLSSSYRGHKKNQKTIYDVELEARVLFDNFAQGPGSRRRPFFLLLPKDAARGSGATPCRRSSTLPASRHRRYCRHHSFSRIELSDHSRKEV